MDNELFKFLLVIVAVSTALFAFAPGLWTPAWIVNHDKFAHFIAFVILSSLFKLSFPKVNLVLVTVLLVTFAVLIEFFQYQFFNRGFSAKDICYDLFGIFLSVIVFKGFDFIISKHNKDTISE